MLLLMLGVGGWAIVRYLLRPLRAPITDDALCYELEKTDKKSGEKLISALEFSRMDWDKHENVSMAMVDKTIEDGEASSRNLAPAGVLESVSLMRNAAGAISIVLLLGAALVWGVLAPNSALATWFQTLKNVPSSYNWKPTKPAIMREMQVAEARPFCMATNQGYAPEPGGTTPQSTSSETMVSKK